MTYHLLKFVLPVVMICCALTSAAQTIRISDELEVTQLTPAVYIHTCNTSNGVIFINRGEAIIVSTPPSDSATLALINWVTDSLKAKIVAYVIDRWHPDAMEGLDMVHLKDITSYSYTKTRQIAIQKGLPIPEITFDPRISLKAGSENVICHFLGEAHTSDGIVVWIPGEKVLFGGNEIRNLNGWAGNIADANLTEWSGSIKRARLMFREAKYVIPGHGPYGDKELMDYTIDLYNFDKNQKNPYRLNPDSLKVRDMMHQFDFRSYKREDLRDNRVAYTNGKINFRKDELDIEIHAPYFTYDMHNRELIIPAGFMSINREKEKQIERFKFDTLRLNLRNDAVGMTILIKSISKS